MAENRRLYLVRHGHAVSDAVDPERPLSERGRETVERVAKWAAREDLEVDRIRHSGKRRAEETAEIFALHLKPAGGVRATPGLAPNDEVRVVAKALEYEQKNVMLVGHLPFMGRLAALLIESNPEHDVVAFPEAGLACLETNGALWAVMFVASPESISENRV